MLTNLFSKLLLRLVDRCTLCDPHARCVGGECICKVGYYGSGYECYRGKLPLRVCIVCAARSSVGDRSF